MALVDIDQFAHQKNETNNNARNDDGPADVGHRQGPHMTTNGLIFADRHPEMIGFAVTGFLRAPTRQGDHAKRRHPPAAHAWRDRPTPAPCVHRFASSLDRAQLWRALSTARLLPCTTGLASALVTRNCFIVNRGRFIGFPRNVARQRSCSWKRARPVPAIRDQTALT